MILASVLSNDASQQWKLEVQFSDCVVFLGHIALATDVSWSV